ncbi:hypothetical protein [Bacillus sp. P14.5]|uniref:hypothetical protein n=1 Tax=Bacillus sp. P14.5 TaxID=1983400 RepID=UPI0013B0573A|nr:hypothetical protein [Bacillus sp. P14.5]
MDNDTNGVKKKPSCGCGSGNGTPRKATVIRYNGIPLKAKPWYKRWFRFLFK